MYIGSSRIIIKKKSIAFVSSWTRLWALAVGGLRPI